MNSINNFYLTASYSKNGLWNEMPIETITNQGFSYNTDSAQYSLEISEKPYGYDFKMSFTANYDTQMKIALTMKQNGTAYHLIPCCIYGDNNIDKIKPGEYPCLTNKHSDNVFCSEYWEFRADRAAAPLSFMELKESCVGISIDPYSQVENGFIRNGVFAMLPASCGVTLGYTNSPVTFNDKGSALPSTKNSAKAASACGSIYLPQHTGKASIHEMIRAEYEKRHTKPTYKKSFETAAKAITDAFININWDENLQSYTDMGCKPPKKNHLKALRPVYEIGWTGLAELAGPLTEASYKFNLDKKYFHCAKMGEELIDQIIGTYNEKSGLLNDLTVPNEDGSPVNGWWAYYGIAKDCHSAYTVGKAVFEILKTILFLKKIGKSYPQKWEEVCLNVLNTIISLQRADGNYGYNYHTNKQEVLDWDGFAGCWFMPAMVYAYQLTGDKKYLESAELAETYYAKFVYNLNCYATPMDTWKAVDEEGNLAFIKGARLLHEITNKDIYLSDLEAGANYEYLWRYAYASRPEYPPIDKNWNSCGGSVTSISNPHIHPMGVIVNDDLRYLYEKTGDEYHLMRAQDGDAWLMQNLELYPQQTGYGTYGVLSERWCASDGILNETYSDGRLYSSWFSFNLWSGANALEALLTLL